MEGRNKQIFINMVSNAINLFANLCVSFFVSPIIVSSLGTDSYGFVTLANNFVSYISLITIALNSVAGRFVSIKIHQKDYKKANIYYNSVLITNVILAFILVILSIFFIYNLENIINIPPNIITSVKILFLLVFLSFYISIIGNVYSIATYVKNRLELSAIRDTALNLFKMIMLLGVFSILSPNIIWIGVASLLVSIITIITNLIYTRRLLPELKLNIREYSFSAVKELISSGCWNTISQVGQILLNGLDLLLANIFVSPASMGILSISKTIPDILGSFASVLVSSFSPSYTKLFAQGKKEELLIEIGRSIKIVGLLFGLPLGGWLAFGQDFFRLWMPTENSYTLYILSVIASLGLFVNGGISCIYNLFTVLNKLKVNSITLIVSGIINSIIVYVLLKTTNLGIYAIAGVSVFILILRNLFISIPYVATVCLEQKWYFFYKYVINTSIRAIAVFLIGILVKKILLINTWFDLILSAGIVVVLYLLISFFFFVDASDRKIIINCIKRRKYVIRNKEKNL